MIDKLTEKRTRPRITSSYTVRMQTGCGKLYVTVGRDKENVIEAFAVLGKGGNCAAAQNEAVTRAITLGMKHGIPIEEYIEEFSEINCSCPAWDDGEFISSCAVAIAIVLQGEIDGRYKSETLPDRKR